MIDRTEAALQIDRLIGLECFIPADKRDAAIIELVLALEAAANNDVAKAVVDDWIASQREWPVPVDLRKLVWEHNEKFDRSRPAPPRQSSRGHCPNCGGDGIRESTRAEDLHSIASYCECSSGRNRELSSCTCVGTCQRVGRQECCYPPWAINRAREKLLGLGSTNPIRKLAETEYRGEF